MSIIRVKKDKENLYVMVDKQTIEDRRLTWKARGLLCYLLSKPNDWHIYVTELIKHTKDGRDSTNNAIDELIEYGYMKREKLPKTKGKFTGYKYTVVENPLRLSRYGKTVNGKPVTTNNNTTNNELTNILKTDESVHQKDCGVNKKNSPTLKFWCKQFNHVCQKDGMFCYKIFNKIVAIKRREFDEKGLDKKSSAFYGAVKNGIKDQIQHPDSMLNVEVKRFLNKTPEWIQGNLED
jgi:hypothetical protein